MSTPAYKHLSLAFLQAMEEIGQHGLEKHGDNSFAAMKVKQRKIARHTTTEILNHARLHITEYELNIGHDHFHGLLHQLAAAAFNLMVEAQFAGIVRELPVPPSFQERVKSWCLFCFGLETTYGQAERNHRYLEESLELVQSLGCTREEAHQLVDYVFDRPAGEPKQELGGALLTLNALATVARLDVKEAGDVELERVWTKTEEIRKKQAAKKKDSPLPGPSVEMKT